MKRPNFLLMIPWAVLLALSVGTANAQQTPIVPDNVEMLRNVEFGKGGNQTLTMHILRPRPLPKEPMPALVYINGSAWMKDNKDLAVGRLIGTAQQGYFGATIQVRTSGEAVFPAQLEDAKCAIRFLRAKAKEYNIDADRIGVWGESSGGHLSALVGLTANVKELEGNGGWPEFSSRVSCVCSMCPAVDFLSPDWPARHNMPNGPAFRLLGGDPGKDKAELAKKASPLTYITKESPPFFIVHGDADTTVPYSQGVLLLDALKKAGVEASMYTIKGGNHGSVHQYNKMVVEEFFDKRLKNSGAGERAPVLFEENFDAKPGDGWAWVRENPTAWKIEKSAMIIRVQPGYLWANVNENERTKNVLLRDLPTDATLPVAVEVCVENDPQVVYEHAGALWYVDDSNYVDLLHESLNGKGGLQMVTKTADKPQYDKAACHSKFLWVRLVISAEDITGQFRESPTDPWHTVAKRKLPSTAKARVGVICGGGEKDSDRVAKFSRFRIVQLAK